LSIFQESISRSTQEINQIQANLNNSPENPFKVAIEQTEVNLNLKRQDLATSESSVAILSHQYELYKLWEVGFGRKGIQSFLIDTIIPLLNEKVAEWAEIIWKGEVEIEFRTQRLLGNGSLKEDFHVHIENRNGAKIFKGNSAGEQERINLCIALALQDLIMSRRGSDLDICFLDEFCHYTDEEGAEAFHAVLEELAKRRGSVFVMTHDQDLQAYFTKIWTVHKRDKVSTLELV
jgi:DNA repair exonuclease SbcCD ATPase subunit